MSDPIQVRNLTKTFRVPERKGGLGAALRSLVRRKYREVHAVSDVSFSVAAGEMVAFLGPNGAGKTTTLKMLAGLLHPTSGDASVLGCQPWRREPDYLRRISMVMGQRSQLQWDIPASDSFEFHAAVYGVPGEQFRKTLAELSALLELEPLLTRPLRNLSLGERMKCEIAGALLHRPSVLFLDEPTIGLDVTMQGRIRRFIQDYNRQFGATIILTSHYMADVTALCRRVIVIHHGRLLFDGSLDELSTRTAPFKMITLDTERDVDGATLAPFGELVLQEPRKLTLRVPKERAAAVTGRLLAELPILDLTIEDPPIEDVITQVFNVPAESAPPGGAAAAISSSP